MCVYMLINFIKKKDKNQAAIVSTDMFINSKNNYLTEVQDNSFLLFLLFMPIRKYVCQSKIFISFCPMKTKREFVSF